MAHIEITADGPLVVAGVTQIRNSRGEALQAEDPFYLCRCGASGNKPFCDGSHKKIGFTALAGKTPAARAAANVGTPAVQVLKDGPNQVTGVPDLRCETPPADPAKYSLCRCGASKKKPYCDGTHRTNGFRDDKN